MKFPSRRDRTDQHARRGCTAAETSLAALVRPGAGAKQRESFRDDTRAAMLREFGRAGAPVRPVRVDADPMDLHVAEVDGVQMSNLEAIGDPVADAAKIRAIIARRRADVQS